MITRFTPGINLRGLPPEVAQWAFARQILGTSQHGMPPSSRNVAAAHEAGHIVVMTSLGDIVDAAEVVCREVLPNIKVWCGANSRRAPRPLVHSVESLTPDQRLISCIRNIAANLSGLAGEETAGLWHPASSLDEESKAILLACEAADQLNTQCPIVLRSIAQFCLEILANNRRPFDSIRKHLERNRRLNRRAASRMLEGVSNRHPLEVLSLLRSEANHAA